MNGVQRFILAMLIAIPLIIIAIFLGITNASEDTVMLVAGGYLAFAIGIAMIFRKKKIKS